MHISVALIFAWLNLLRLAADAADPTHGAIAGDVTDTEATVWSRTDENATMYVSVYECDIGNTAASFESEVEVDSSHDYTGQVDFDSLTPETCYQAEVVFSTKASATPAYANFTTAPEPSVMRAVKFAWGGDISGQNICRDAEEGFPIMDALKAVTGLDFFVGLGDAIYADGVCDSTGLGGNRQVEGDFVRSANMDEFYAHWRYNLEDTVYQTILSSQPYFMTWDDHEVVNDFGPDYDTRSTGPYTAGESLLPLGRQAFLDYNPIRLGRTNSDTIEFYRSIRWGKGLELFVLDTRQYRSLPTEEDSVADPKTMLGDTQLEWLKDSLTNSTAVWKVIVTSVPLSVPTGSNDSMRDGWANYEGNTGYEVELEDILSFLQENNMHDLIFITADVHFAQGLVYQPFSDDPSFDVHEIIVGPLNAGLFPEEDLDMTFSPERLFYYSSERNSLSEAYTYDETKEFFNFGVAEIDELSGNLTISIINTNSEVIHTMTIEPQNTDVSSLTPAPSIGSTVTAEPVAADIVDTPAPALTTPAPVTSGESPAPVDTTTEEPTVANGEPSSSARPPADTPAPTTPIGDAADEESNTTFKNDPRIILGIAISSVTALVIQMIFLG